MIDLIPVLRRSTCLNRQTFLVRFTAGELLCPFPMYLLGSTAESGQGHSSYLGFVP